MFGECESTCVSVCVQLKCYFTLIVCFGKLLPACNVLTDWRLPGPLANKSHAPLRAAGEATFLPRLSNSPCRGTTQHFTPIRKRKKIMLFPSAVLDFKHSIISFPHVENNVHWNLVQVLHHGTGALGFGICLGQPFSTPSLTTLRSVRVDHVTATVHLGLPQWPLQRLSRSSDKKGRQKNKILTSFLLQLIQPKRYFGSNLITNKIISTLAKESQNFSFEVKSLPTALWRLKMFAKREFYCVQLNPLP